MSELTDARLLEQFRQGDTAALDLLLGRYETPLFHFLIGMLRDHHQAEDALQETFIRALERLDGVSPEHLRGWLFTVAYHQAMLVRRRQKGRRVESLPGDGLVEDERPGPLQEVETQDECRQVWQLLQSLPSSQREVIQQRVYEGKRFREIAELQGCPLNTALARMHEGLKRLRLLWGNTHA